jgi:hypothetical protein
MQERERKKEHNQHVLKRKQERLVFHNSNHGQHKKIIAKAAANLHSCMILFYIQFDCLLSFAPL